MSLSLFCLSLSLSPSLALSLSLSLSHQTLTENGIHDESEEYYDLHIDDDYYYPAIHLYFNDDLTIA